MPKQLKSATIRFRTEQLASIFIDNAQPLQGETFELQAAPVDVLSWFGGTPDTFQLSPGAPTEIVHFQNLPVPLVLYDSGSIEAIAAFTSRPQLWVRFLPFDTGRCRIEFVERRSHMWSESSLQLASLAAPVIQLTLDKLGNGNAAIHIDFVMEDFKSILREVLSELLRQVQVNLGTKDSPRRKRIHQITADAEDDTFTTTPDGPTPTDRRLNGPAAGRLVELVDLRDQILEGLVDDINISKACKKIGLDTRTVRIHAPELVSQWDDHEIPSVQLIEPLLQAKKLSLLMLENAKNSRRARPHATSAAN